MAKKRFNRSNNRQLITHSDVVQISTEINGQLFFEIGNEITTDIAEAVAMMMRNPRIDKSLWNREFTIDINSIEPKRAIYWLSGGDEEWITLPHYNKPWNLCDLDYQQEFGLLVMSILRKSKNLGDIRDGFINHLSLPTLYEFALINNLVR